MNSSIIPEHENPSPQTIVLRIIVSNGNPAHDTTLSFEFIPNHPGTAWVWRVKLPALKNPDAFPRRVAPKTWKLELEAVDQTQPLQICHYTPQTAQEWLKDLFEDPVHAPTELLILAHGQQFTVTIHQARSK